MCRGFSRVAGLVVSSLLLNPARPVSMQAATAWWISLRIRSNSRSMFREDHLLLAIGRRDASGGGATPTLSDVHCHPHRVTVAALAVTSTDIDMTSEVVI